MDLTDSAVSVREGEQLDLARVEEFLKDNIPGLSGKLEVGQFPSGFSNGNNRSARGEPSTQTFFESAISCSLMKRPSRSRWLETSRYQGTVPITFASNFFRW